MNIITLLLAGAGGFLGSVARYATVHLVDKKMNALFPYGTFVVNVTGSFVLGLIAGLLYKSAAPHDPARVFFATGFCGGFTTFSAFALDNLNLIGQKAGGISILYILTSVAASLLTVYLGILAGRGINS